MAFSWRAQSVLALALVISQGHVLAKIEPSHADTDTEPIAVNATESSANATRAAPHPVVEATAVTVSASGGLEAKKAAPTETNSPDLSLLDPKLPGRPKELPKAGDLFAFGKGVAGKLGQGDRADSFKDAKLVEKLKGFNITKMACGVKHSLAITKKKKVYCWGEQGKCGLASKESDKTIPMQMVALDPFAIVAVRAGTGHSMALTTTGGILVWGESKNGQLGLGPMNNTIYIPTKVAKIAGRFIVSISAVDDASMALTETGDVFTWGGGPDNHSPKMIPTMSGRGTSQIAAGAKHYCGLTSNNEVLAWGANDADQLGQEAVGDEEKILKSEVPVKVGGLADQSIVLLKCGSYHCGVITLNNELLLWGGGRSGKLGQGNPRNFATPTKWVVPDQDDEIVQFSPGYQGTLTITKGGSLWYAGVDMAGGEQIISPIPIANSSDDRAFFEVSMGDTHFLAGGGPPIDHGMAYSIFTH